MSAASRATVQPSSPARLARSESRWWSRVRSAGTYSLVDGMARVAVFLALVYAARVLGPRAFGEFVIVYTAAQITTLVADMGLTTLVLRQGARSGRVHAGPFWTALALNGVASAVCAVGLCAAFALLYPSATVVAAIYIPTLLMLAVTTSLEAAAIAAARPVRVAGCRLAGNTCVLGLTVVLLGAYASSSSLVAFAFLVGGFVKLASIVASTWSVVPEVLIRPRLVGPLLRKALPFYGSAVAAFLYQRVDILLLGGVAGVVAAGEYAAAYRMLDGALLLPAAIVAAFIPTWTVRRRTADGSGKAVSGVVLLLVCIGVVVALELVLARDFVVDVLYGESYRSSVGVLATLALSIPVFYADCVLVWVAYARGKERAVALLGALALASNVALNIVLIRAFGAVGAAAATVATEALISLGYAILLGAHRREHRITVLRTLATAGAFAGAMSALAVVCSASGAPRLPVALVMAGIGVALLAMVYRREMRPAFS